METLRNVDLSFYAKNATKPILIATHENPDGDAIGSLVGLGLYLHYLWGAHKNNQPIILYSPDYIPDNLQFITEGMTIYSEYSLEELKKHEYAATILVNARGPDRCRLPSPEAIRWGDHIIIDHHLDDHPWAGFLLHDSEEVSSTCALIVEQLLQHFIPSKKIAQALLLGITTDSLNFSIATQTDHIAAGACIHQGASPQVIRDNLAVENYEDLLYLSKAIEENTAFFYNKRVVISWIDVPTVASYIGSRLVGMLRNIQGVEIAVAISQGEPVDVDADVDGPYKLRFEFRSKIRNVRDLAVMLGGGGHERAAGASGEGWGHEAAVRVLDLICPIYEI